MISSGVGARTVDVNLEKGGMWITWTRLSDISESQDVGDPRTIFLTI